MGSRKKRVVHTKQARMARHVPNGIYIGLDQSVTGTGLTALNEGGELIATNLVSGGEVKEPMDKCNRIVSIFARCYEWINDLKGDKVPCIVLEDFAYSQANQMALLGGLGYHIRIMLRQTGWHFAVCPTGTLKKVVTGSGNSSKALMIRDVYKRWGFETDNDNIADAFGLAKIAWVAYGQPVPGTVGTRKADFEALEKLEVYK